MGCKADAYIYHQSGLVNNRISSIGKVGDMQFDFRNNETCTVTSKSTILSRCWLFGLVVLSPLSA